MRLAHDDVGQGPAVVLLHGFPLDRTMWRSQVEDPSADYRLIVPDLPGLGGSPVPHGPPTLDAMADAVMGLLDELGVTEPVVLGGLSMGGYVALAALEKAPGRFRALMLLDTRATPDTAEAAANREALAKKVEEAGGPHAVVEGMRSKLFSKATVESSPGVVESVVGVMSRAPAAGVAWSLRAMAARPDRTAAVVAAGLPTLVLVGHDDAITPPKEMEALAGSLKSARLVVVPDAGHLPPVEQPEVCNDDIRAFLNTLP